MNLPNASRLTVLSALAPFFFSPGLIAQTAAPANAPKDSGEVVKSEAVNVSSTTLGRYAEDSSSSALKVPTDLKEIAGSLQIMNVAAISDRKAVSLDDIYPYVIGM